jgi:hypothetical protein
MPITVRVQNVQSVEDATIVIEGFTVISGPNNSGKTAVLRAIKGAFTNAPAGSLVRHGADHLTVDIDFGDGNTLCWKKGAKINQYTVNGKVLDNVGRGVPAEVEALGIRYMQAGTEKVWPQIAEQFTGVLFLVGSTGSTVAEAIADVDRVGRLSSALKLAEECPPRLRLWASGTCRQGPRRCGPRSPSSSPESCSSLAPPDRPLQRPSRTLIVWGGFRQPLNWPSPTVARPAAL